MIVDEAHERDVHTDVLLMRLKEMTKLNRQLKLIIMSASIQIDKFVRYFEGYGTFLKKDEREFIRNEPATAFLPVGRPLHLGNGPRGPVDLDWLAILAVNGHHGYRTLEVDDRRLAIDPRGRWPLGRGSQSSVAYR